MTTSGDINLDYINNFFHSVAAPQTLKITPTATLGRGIIRTVEPDYKSFPFGRGRGRGQGIDYAEKYLKEDRNQYFERSLPKEDEDDSESSLNKIEEVTNFGEIPSLSDLDHEDERSLYSAYYHNPIAYNPDLPVLQFKEKIIKFVNNFPVVVVQGPTGCGKTTQVPQYILDYHATQSKHCNIVVTQPRRIAAISIAKRVCQERQWELGSICGYQVALENKTSKDTRLSYVTTGVLLQYLISNGNMNKYTHVILDEVHERDQETDFALLVCKKLLHSVSKGVKIILMSATIAASQFAEYFPILTSGKLEHAPIFDIVGKTRYVQEFYIDELRTLGSLPDLDPCTPCIPPESYNLAFLLIKAFDRIESQEQQCDGNPKFRGSVLVFLPGYEEISRMKDTLQAEVVNKKWWIIPLHSTITLNEQQQVFGKPREHERKIILSTNIAESSITVTDIKYVIDFCLTKCLVNDPETNYSCLQLEWASKANCTQRKGRAGRVSEGRVYRMVSKKFFNTFLPDYGIPEIKRCPIEQLVLKAKKLNFGEPHALLALALDPPDLGDIERAILVLKEAGALAPTSNGKITPYDGDLTFMGRVMLSLPLDVKISKMILLGYIFDCLQECLVIAASLSLKTFFVQQFQKSFEAYKSKLFWSYGTFSDTLAYLNAFNDWKQRKQRGYFTRPGGLKEKDWGEQYFIQIKRIREVDMLVEELKKRLDKFNIQLRTHPRPSDAAKDALILRMVIAGAFYPNYFIQDENDEREICRFLHNKDPFSTVMISGLPSNQGILYAHNLQHMLTCCSDTMKIDFDEGKALIEFDDPEKVESGIMKAVYLAVKMRKLRMHLDLRLFSNNEAQRKLAQLQKLKEERLSKSKMLHTNRVSVNLTKNKVKPTPLPGLRKLIIQIHVTEVTKNLHFFARYKDDAAVVDSMQFINHAINMTVGAEVAAKSQSDIQSTQNDNQSTQSESESTQSDQLAESDNRSTQSSRMSSHSEKQTQQYRYGPRGIPIQVPGSSHQQYQNYPRSKRRGSASLTAAQVVAGQTSDSPPQFPSHLGPFEKGVIVLAPLGIFLRRQYRDSMYGRARVDEINGDLVKVFFIDYGNCLRVHVNELIPIDASLTPDLLTTPGQVFECALSEIKPSALASPNGNWTQEAFRLVRDAICGKTLYAKVYSVVDQIVRLELYVADQGRTISINDELITYAFAERAEENYASKQNNEIRTYAEQQTSFDSSNPEFEINEMFMQLNIEETEELEMKRSTQKIQLKGPFSPLEVNFKGITQLGSSKIVRIDRDSVNSVALNPEPQDKHTRMLVASHIGLSPNGDAINAYNSTMLPNIHGLASLIVLIFAPVMELRTDTNRTQYTGALCGLGYDVETGQSIYPEHDMELTFDTKFGATDISNINSVRMGINLLLGSKDDEIINWGPQGTQKVQNKARESLLKLITQKRVSQNPWHFHKRYQWQQIDPEHLLLPELQGSHQGDCAHVLPLHKAISLNEQIYLEEMTKHMQDLYSKADRNDKPIVIKCLFCSETILSTRDLFVHLKEKSHKKNEDSLLKISI